MSESTELFCYRFFNNFTDCFNVALTDEPGLKNPVGIYLLKVSNRNTRTRCEICLKLK